MAKSLKSLTKGVGDAELLYNKSRSCTKRKY